MKIKPNDPGAFLIKVIDPTTNVNIGWVTELDTDTYECSILTLDEDLFISRPYVGPIKVRYMDGDKCLPFNEENFKALVEKFAEKTFKLKAFESRSFEVEVKAKNIEDAALALTENPDDYIKENDCGEYVADSFEVDMEASRELNAQQP